MRPYIFTVLVVGGLAAPAAADTDATACHITLTETTRRLDHRVTSCKSADDTKYDEKLETSTTVRAACTIELDDSGVTINLEDSEPASGTAQMKQENQGTYGSRASSSTTIQGSASGGLILLKQPGGALTPQGSLSFQARSTSQMHLHDNCDKNHPDYDHSDTSDLNALVAPFRESLTAPPVFKISLASFEQGFASHRPFTVTGAGTYDWHDDSANADIHSDVKLIVDVGSVGYEAILEPVDDDGYDKWLPAGPAIDAVGQSGKPPRGNSITFRAYLRDKKTKKEASGQTYTVKFKLTGVSHIPGVAMNLPRLADREFGADLFFARDLNPDGTVSGDDNEAIAFAKGNAARTVLVSARDYGAFGHLQAELEVDHTKLVATMNHAGKETSEATIPLDTNGNQIADAWEDAHHILAKDLPANDDSEPPPPGMQTKGDGYTLYEEYRGFVVETFKDGQSKLEYQQLDPERQDLLVSPYAEAHRDDLIAAATLFGQITGFAIHVIKGRDQLAWRDGDMKVYFTRGNPVNLQTMPRWVNFNALPGDTKHFGPKQVAMRLFTASVGTGNSAPNDGSDGVRDTPKGSHMSHGAPVDYVGAAVSWSLVDEEIGLWFDNLNNKTEVRLEKGLEAAHLDRANVVAAAHDPTARKLLQQRLFRFAVMHEMGHNTGAAHHSVDTMLAVKGKVKINPEEEYYSTGDPHCPMRYWQFALIGIEKVEFLAGTWDPTLTSYWHFCTENAAQMHLH